MKLKVFAIFCLCLALSSCEEKTITFIHASDPQIGFLDETAGYRQSDSLFRAAISAWNSMSPEAVFITGDLVNNPHDSLQNAVYDACRAEIESPLYELPGNHDIRGWSPENLDLYLSHRGYQRFSVIIKGCAFIGIDSNCIKDGAAEAESEQMEWLRGELAKAEGCRHKILFLHCPIIRESIDEPEDYFNFSLDKRTEYISLLKEYGVGAVLSGHTHMEYKTVLDGILFAAAGPVGSPLGRGYSGFSVVTVSPSGIDWEYVATPDAK